MKIGSKVVFKSGDTPWHNSVYIIRRFTTDGKRVRLNQAINHRIWQELDSLRLATMTERKAGRRQ